MERDREAGAPLPQELETVAGALKQAGVPCDLAGTEIGSTIFANMPGDGSARSPGRSGRSSPTAA